MPSPDSNPFQRKGVSGNPDVMPEKPEVGEYPKWIEPDPAHVEKTGDGRPFVTTHECHIDRGGTLTIVVADKDDEDRMKVQEAAVVDSEKPVGTTAEDKTEEVL